MRLAVFRCDANSRIGIGHVMRCITLATEMCRQGWQCIFVCEAGSTEYCHFLKNSQHDVIEYENINASGLQNIVKDTVGRSADLFIVDHYSIGFAFEAELQQSGAKLMVIDDLCDRPHSCDFLLDQTFDRDADEYKKYVQNNSKIVTGSSFTLVRHEFSMLRAETFGNRNLRAQKGLQSILLTFGGTDRTSLILEVLSGLNQCGQIFQVDIVFGQIEQLQKLESEVSQFDFLTCNLHYEVQYMARLMIDADLAIAAGGTTSWERCCLGLPTFVVILADNQETIARNLEKAGAVKVLGRSENISATLVEAAIRDFSVEKRREMVIRSMQVCDGTGSEAVVSMLNELFL